MSELVSGGDQALEPIDKAKLMIALAVAQDDVETLTELRHRASAFELYHDRAGSRELANDAGEIKVRAERGLGQIDTAKNPRGRPQKGQGTLNFSLEINHDTRAAWRKLGELSEQRLEEFIRWAREDENSGVTTSQMIEYLRTGSQGSSTTFECYTPAEYVEAAREVLGAIDLDPASSTEANETIKAARIFSEEDDGLAHEWHGRIWLNPPYGRKLTSEFVAKAVDEYNAGRVTAAILLLNAYGFDAAWFQPLWDGVLCFTDHRIKFYGGGPTFGSLFVYLGSQRAEFARVFGGFGAVVEEVAA